MKTVILLALALLVPHFAAADNALASVKRIYVAPIDGLQGGELLRMAIQREIARAGFTSVTATNDADATLTLRSTPMTERDPAPFTAVLTDRSGRSLWEKDFRPSGDSARRARDIAKALQHACRPSRP